MARSAAALAALVLAACSVATGPGVDDPVPTVAATTAPVVATTAPVVATTAPVVATTAPPVATTAPAVATTAPSTVDVPPPVIASVVDGVSVTHLTNDDPALPISIQYPVLAGGGLLDDVLAERAAALEAVFREWSVPSAAAPPELNVGWEWATVADPYVAVRLLVSEFAGASWATSSEVYYTDVRRGTVATSRDLIARDHRAAAVMAVREQLVERGIAYAEVESPPAPAEVLTDVTIAAGGEVVVRVPAGVLAPFSEDSPVVVIDAVTAAAWLSDAGRSIAAAVADPQPIEPITPPTTTAAPATAPTTAPATPPATTPPTSGGSASVVDCQTARCVALTFDDGPGRYTSRLLDTLADAGAPATFFVLGQNVEVHADLLGRMANEGHVVGNHSWDHKNLTKLSGGELTAEITRTDDVVRSTIGSVTNLMRPPYGAYDDSTRALGKAVILWDVDTLDWKHRDAAETVRRTMADVEAGSIVLLHDIHQASVDAVPELVPRLRAEGYTLVTIPQLLGRTEPGTVYTARGSKR